MVERYVNEMMKVESIIRKKIIWRGLVNSVAQSIPFFGYAAALCYGGFLIANGEIHFKNVIKWVKSRCWLYDWDENLKMVRINFLSIYSE